MTYEAADALGLCARGFGLAALQQALEGFRLAPALVALGFRLPVTGSAEATQLCAWRMLSGLRLGLGVCLLISGASWLIPLLALSNAWNWAGTRGPFNGGSDSMTATLGLGLSVAWLGRELPWLSSLGLYFIAVHAVLSYFVSGLAKLKEPAWRSGSALAAALSGPRYNGSAWLLALLEVPTLARVASYGTIAFECLFPLALLRPEWTLGTLAAGAAFHGVNSFALGLHRFLPVWLSTYPAIVYLSIQLDSLPAA